MLATTGV